MNAKTEEGINKAMNQARINGIRIDEIWLGPTDYGAVKDNIETRETKEFLNGIRVRQMAEDQIPRVGVTTCGEGPGVT